VGLFLVLLLVLVPLAVVPVPLLVLAVVPVPLLVLAHFPKFAFLWSLAYKTHKKMLSFLPLDYLSYNLDF
jgi:hypothetical protein